MHTMTLRNAYIMKPFELLLHEHGEMFLDYMFCEDVFTNSCPFLSKLKTHLLSCLTVAKARRPMSFQ